jgi:hypothetical protein
LRRLPAVRDREGKKTLLEVRVQGDGEVFSIVFFLAPLDSLFSFAVTVIVVLHCIIMLNSAVQQAEQTLFKMTLLFTVLYCFAAPAAHIILKNKCLKININIIE